MAITKHPESSPVGLELEVILRGHRTNIYPIAWSPDGTTLASGACDGAIKFWDVRTGEVVSSIETSPPAAANALTALEGNFIVVFSLAWSPDGALLAVGTGDRLVRLWDTRRAQLRRTLEGHADAVLALSWSPDGRTLASAGGNSIQLWDVSAFSLRQTLNGHSAPVYSLAWLHDGTLVSGGGEGLIVFWGPDGNQLSQLIGHSNEVLHLCPSADGRMLASSSADRTIRIWNPANGRATAVLEGHMGAVTAVSYSPDSRILASKSADESIRIWDCESWECLAVLDESATGSFFAKAAFSPRESLLATLGERDSVIRVWQVKTDLLLRADVVHEAVRYSNAKVVLVGDSGVGKTALGLVLAGGAFVPTESTHGRHVWTFDTAAVRSNGHEETRQIFVWDLAGQPGYRLIHQLSLHETSVAVVVFDARSEIDPFGSVKYWRRALHQAQLQTGSTATEFILVAARGDRGGVLASRKQIDGLVASLGFSHYLETSAKTGQNVSELAEAIRNGVDWDALPTISSTRILQRIRAFLIAERHRGSVLSTMEDLYLAFLSAQGIRDVCCVA